MPVDHCRPAASDQPTRFENLEPQKGTKSTKVFLQFICAFCAFLWLMIMNSDHSLRSAHLVKHYGRRRVVDDVSLQVDKGEVVGLLGANGAGKTTTFYMIVGLERPDSGSVLLGDQDLTKLPMYLRARLGIGYLPQEPSVFRKMTTAQNILAVLETTGLRRREQLKRLEELLEEFGIAHVRNTRGDALSGGERRRTEIARALATEPQ